MMLLCENVQKEPLAFAKVVNSDERFTAIMQYFNNLNINLAKLPSSAPEIGQQQLTLSKKILITYEKSTQTTFEGFILEKTS